MISTVGHFRKVLRGDMVVYNGIMLVFKVDEETVRVYNHYNGDTSYNICYRILIQEGMVRIDFGKRVSNLDYSLLGKFL